MASSYPSPPSSSSPSPPPSATPPPICCPSPIRSRKHARPPGTPQSANPPSLNLTTSPQTTTPTISSSLPSASLQWISRPCNSMLRPSSNASTSDRNRTNAAENYLQFLTFSDKRLAAAYKAIRGSGPADARAWDSAALLYQYDCWCALKYVNLGVTVKWWKQKIRPYHIQKFILVWLSYIYIGLDMVTVVDK